MLTKLDVRTRIQNEKRQDGNEFVATVAASRISHLNLLLGLPSAYSLPLITTTVSTDTCRDNKAKSHREREQFYPAEYVRRCE